MASLREKLAVAAKPLKDGGKPGKPAPDVRRGADIFAHVSGGGGPRCWDEYVGQGKAKALLRMRIAGAKVRGERLDHVLIASGFPGIGKSALGRLIAAEMGAGIVEIQGDMDSDDALSVFGKMEDGDILFIDEGHKLVDGGKKGAEWLLPVLQDGVLIDSEGIHAIPAVTVVVATTDKDVLPQTILDRLPIVPAIEPYGVNDAAEIARRMADGIGNFMGVGGEEVKLGAGTLEKIARACSETPRLIAGMLGMLRDALSVGLVTLDSEGEGELGGLFDLMDVTEDGLDAVSQNMLLALLSNGGVAGANTLAAKLGEPIVPKHAERVLMMKGYMVIQPQGRCLTEDGKARAGELAMKFAG